MAWPRCVGDVPSKAIGDLTNSENGPLRQSMFSWCHESVKTIRIPLHVLILMVICRVTLAWRVLLLEREQQRSKRRSFDFIDGACAVIEDGLDHVVLGFVAYPAALEKRLERPCVPASQLGKGDDA